MGNFYGIPVRALNPHSASLISPSPTSGSSELLTGGDFGTRAALTMLVAAAVAFIAWRRSSQERVAARVSAGGECGRADAPGEPTPSGCMPRS